MTNREWIVRLVAALIPGVLVAAGVAAFDGPTWAIYGFCYTAYLVVWFGAKT